MIDPSIWADEDFGKLSSDAKVMFIGLFSNADDAGVLPGDPTYLSATIFPFNGLSPKKASKICKEIETKMKSVFFYSDNCKKYIKLKKFLVYQKINRPSPSKYPQPPKDNSPHEEFYEESMTNHGNVTPNRNEKNIQEENQTNFSSEEESFRDQAWSAAVEASAAAKKGGGL